VACLGVSQGGGTILLPPKVAGHSLRHLRECLRPNSPMPWTVASGITSASPAGWAFCWSSPSLNIAPGGIDQVNPARHIANLPALCFLSAVARTPRRGPEDTQRLFEAAREPKELWMVPKLVIGFVRTGVRTQSAGVSGKIHEVKQSLEHDHGARGLLMPCHGSGKGMAGKRMAWLGATFGKDRMIWATVVLPTTSVFLPVMRDRRRTHAFC